MTYIEHHKYHIIKLLPTLSVYKTKTNTLYFLNKETCLIEKKIYHSAMDIIHVKINYDPLQLPTQYLRTQKISEYYWDEETRQVGRKDEKRKKKYYKITWENNTPITYTDHNGNWWDKNIFQSELPFHTHLVDAVQSVKYIHQLLLLEMDMSDSREIDNPILRHIITQLERNKKRFNNMGLNPH